MAKIDQIRRLVIIVSKLWGGRYVPAKELVDYVEDTLRNRYSSNTAGVTQRTLQRDFKAIEDLFGIVINNSKNRGYYILNKKGIAEDYEELLLNFEILNAIDSDSVIKKYVLPEHRRQTALPTQPVTHNQTSTLSSFSLPLQASTVSQPVMPNIMDLIDAIRDCHPVEFDYILVRHGGKVIHKKFYPHFLKESQQRWYLVGYDESDKLKTLGLDRLFHLRVLDGKFTRKDNEDKIQELFRDSFGIWNNPEDPVEEIVLKYDALDGAFVKTLPLHSSQEVLEDGPDGITIRLRLRITNDFVMALLARSRSLEVVSPAHLRQRVYDVYLAALDRNQPDTSTTTNKN